MAPDKGRETRHDLKRTIDEVRNAQAAREDAVISLRIAERTRLDLLMEELEDVIAAIPTGDDQFTFAVTPGETLRLWVDATSFVMMARDQHTYRFVKDSRIGRAVLEESEDVSVIADAVTRYVAERVVERQRAIEGDWMLERLRNAESNKTSGRSFVLWGILGFLFGLAVGVGGLSLAARYGYGLDRLLAFLA